MERKKDMPMQRKAQWQHPLYPFCDLPAVKNTNDHSAEWRALKKKEVPSVETVQATADSLSDDEWSRVRNTVRPFETTGAGVAGAGGVSLPSTSTLLWGVTDFLVTRGKEQLAVYVLVQAGKRICAADVGGPLLPATCALLSPSGPATIALPGASALREAARHDLHQLPGTSTTLAIGKRKAWPDSAVADAAQVARLAGFFVGVLLDGSDPLNALIGVAGIPPVEGSNIPYSERATPAAVSLRTIAAFVATIEPDSVSRALNWPAGASGVKLANFYANKALLVNLVAGAPYPWSTEPVPDDICEGSAVPCGALLTVAERVTTITRLVDSTRVRAFSFASASNDSARIVTAAKLLGAANDFLVTVVNIGGDRPGFARMALTIHGLVDVTNSLVTKEYGNAVRRSVGLLDTLGLVKELPKQAGRILSLASDVATAQDADGVSSALDHFVGKTTFLQKREPTSGWHMFVNAYAGAAYGNEDACRGVNTCAQNGRFGGAYFPIGVELGHVVDWRGASWLIRSAGVFVQAVDLGALASWRLGTADSISNAPTVGGKQVLAPGAHIVFGIRSLPLSIGIGRSVAPSLRKVSSAGIVEERNAVRSLSLFAAIDIPLFP